MPGKVPIGQYFPAFLSFLFQNMVDADVQLWQHSTARLRQVGDSTTHDAGAGPKGEKGPLPARWCSSLSPRSHSLLRVYALFDFFAAPLTAQFDGRFMRSFLFGASELIFRLGRD